MDNREPTHDSPFHNTSSQQQQGWTITNDQEATRLQSKADKAMEAEKQIRKRKRAEEEAKAKKVEKEKKEKEERERKRKRDAEDEKRPWFI